jgi:hypothetical protein
MNTMPRELVESLDYQKFFVEYISLIRTWTNQFPEVSYHKISTGCLIPLRYSQVATTVFVNIGLL